MIKLVMCLARHPDMTRQQFQDYWLNQHGPFFQKHAGDMRSVKYVQSHTIDTPANREGIVDLLDAYENSGRTLPADIIDAREQLRNGASLFDLFVTLPIPHVPFIVLQHVGDCSI